MADDEARANQENASETNEAAPKRAQTGKHPLPARGTIVGTHVSWEEQRKGMTPQSPQGIDATFYDEHFTSEQQRVDRPSSDWKVLDPEGSAADAPNWPPPLRH